MKVKLHPKLGQVSGSFANGCFYLHENGDQSLRPKAFNGNYHKPTEKQLVCRNNFEEGSKMVASIYHDKDRKAEYERTCPPNLSLCNYIMKRVMEELK
jgi:hypothetical protein